MNDRKTYAKERLHEDGIGSVPCHPAWESQETDEGAFARLDVADDGRVFLSITDMEEFDGSYVSVEIDNEQFNGLQRVANADDELFFGERLAYALVEHLDLLAFASLFSQSGPSDDAKDALAKIIDAIHRRSS